MNSSRFIDKAFAFTAKNALFSAPCHLIVAVSGGPDSMALLHALRHWPEKGLCLSVVHINHGLRGESALRDEEFVRHYCLEHALDLTVFHEDVGEYAATHKLTVEEAGRELRYQRFESLRCSCGADVIVTAHTASDQAETLLMHIIRGCGIDGLCGIPAKRGHICRPLLGCTREEVLSYCHEHHVPYVTDETNEDVRFTRNRIRCEVLPLLRELNPAVNDSLLRLQRHAADDVSFLDASANELLQAANQEGEIIIKPFLDAPQPIRRRALRLLLRQHHLRTVEEAHIHAIEHTLLTGCGKTLLPGNRWALVQGGVLTIQNNDDLIHDAAFSSPISELPFSFSACGKQHRLFLKNGIINQNVHKLFANQAIDYDTIQGSLLIRPRQAGDTLRPSGRGISKSIKKLMNEWKIPADLRPYYPLLCDESGVLLVPGYACDQRAAVSAATQRILVWESYTEQE